MKLFDFIKDIETPDYFDVELDYGEISFFAKPDEMTNESTNVYLERYYVYDTEIYFKDGLGYLKIKAFSR